MVPAYPRYLSGFVHARQPVPALTDFVVEAVSNAFGRLPDPVLLPWLPTLITTLRSSGTELAPLLIREAGRIFPGRLAALDAWVPLWRAQSVPETPPSARGADDGPGVALLAAHPATCDAVASLLGRDGTWRTAAPARPGRRCSVFIPYGAGIGGAAGRPLTSGPGRPGPMAIRVRVPPIRPESGRAARGTASARSR